MIQLFIASTVSEASPTPAGVLIRNFAEATYFDEATGVYETVRSNEVTIAVAAVPVLNVSGGLLQHLSRGTTAAQHFVLFNAGNTPVDTAVTVVLASDPTLLRAATLHVDANRNGVVDAGEAEVLPSTLLHLQPGEELGLIYGFNVSPEALPGETVSVMLEASPALTALGAPVDGTFSAVGEVIVSDRALKLSKSVSERGIGADVELTYRLALRNDSEASVAEYSEVDGQTISVDGAPASGILVRDPIPVPAQFSGIDAIPGVQALVHVRGEPVHSYRRSAPTDPSVIDAVAFLIPGDYEVGRATDMSFRVLLSPPEGAFRIDNTAETFLPDPSGPDAVPSNTVSTWFDGAGTAVLDFVSVIDFSPVAFGSLGEDIALSLEASGCNISGGIDRATITVRSGLTGDSEQIVAVETGANTGVFRTGPLPLISMPDPVSLDGAMATTRGDNLAATVTCQGNAATADLPISPGSFVFDSVTNEPVEGAVIALTDDTGNELVRVTTDAHGYFSLPEMPSGTYSYVVSGIQEYRYPSVKNGFSGFGRTIHSEASFGMAFSHSGGFIEVDLPIDPSPAVPLTLTKSALVTETRTGGVVAYTLLAENLTDQALALARIDDVHPAGFQLVPGSVRVAGAPVSDPVATGQTFAIELGMIAPGSSVEVTYLMQVGPSVREGEAVNIASLSGRQAGTGIALFSAPAQAAVRVDNEGGALSRQATIIGSVFMDCDGDGLRGGPDEPGIPGVRILTQQGLSVVTDIDGKYSIAGLRPRAHVLSVRENSLPKGVAVTVTRSSDLREGGARLVRLRAGELVSEHFAVEACSPGSLADVADRVERFSDRAPRASDLRGDLPFTGGAQDRRSVRTEAGLATSTQILRSEAAQLDARQSAHNASVEPRIRALSETIRAMTPETAILGLVDGAVLKRGVLNLRVKGSSDLILSVSVNGKELGPSRIGEKATWEAGKVQAIEYVAVKLAPGSNDVELLGRDPFGNVRERIALQVFAPGEVARLEIVAPEAASARQGARIPVVVRFADADGRTSETSGVVTLGANLATWDVQDMRPGQPGLQVYVDRGEATFDLLAPQVTGTDRLTVDSSFGRAETQIAFSPDLEERIFVGIIEGAVALRGQGKAIEPGRISPFEDTVEGLNGELYFKGRIRGDALLTARYSSDKDTQDRLFNDIRRDEFYPVYGDNAEHGYDAQSSTNLYVKVEKGQSYILYGDIAIAPELPYYRLGAQSRVTTGVKVHREGDAGRIVFFVARTRQKQQVVEFEGKGVSGPYPLNLDGYVETSERVEVLVRDRDTGEVLSTSPMVRYSDYALDFFANTILFRDPLPQADANSNPVSVRVTYEIKNDKASRHWLYGGEVSATLSETTEAGLRVIHDAARKGAGERNRLAAAVIRSQIDGSTSVEVEIAQSVSEEDGRGSAARLSVEQETSDARSRFEASHTDAEFNPEGSSIPRGTDRVAFEHRQKVSETVSVDSSAEYTNDRIAGRERVEAEVIARREVSALAETRMGARLSRDLTMDEKTSLGVLAGSTWRPTEESRFRFSVDLEGQLRGSSPDILEIGVDYTVSERLTFSGLARLRTGSNGDLDHLEHFKLGVDYEVNDWLSGRTEMTSDATGGRSLGGAVTQDLSASWDPTDQLTLTGRYEHSEPFNSDRGSVTSVATGADYESAEGDWVAQGDFERLWEDTRSSDYVSLGLAAQTSEDWTLLARARLAKERSDSEGDSTRRRTRIGAAYRPTENPRLEMLAWYEQLREKRAGSSRLDHEWLVQGTYEVNEDARLNGRYSGIRSKSSTGGVHARSLTQLVQGGATFDLLDERWHLTLNAGRMWDQAGNARNLAGVEVGYAFATNTVASVGYWTSRGDEMVSGRLHSDGAYFNIRMILDEHLLDYLASFM